MKINTNIIVKQVGNEYMVISDINSQTDYTHVTTLNEAAAFLIQNSNEDFSEDDWVSLLINRYNVNETVAKEDVSSLILTLKEAKIIV